GDIIAQTDLEPAADFADESFERELPEPVSIEPEVEREPDEDSSRERPRRGRKRGRRGQRGDAREREERPRTEGPRTERAPLAQEAHHGSAEPAESADLESNQEVAD